MKDSASQVIIKTLTDRGLITPDQVHKITKEHRQKGSSVLEIIGELGSIPSDPFMAAAASALGIPAIRLSKCKISNEVLSLIPKKVAVSYQAVPLSKCGDILTVVVADPLNMIALENIESITGLTVLAVLSTLQEIREAVDVFYNEDTSKELRDAVKEVEYTEVSVVREDTGQAITDVSELMNLTQEEPIVRLTDHILTEGIGRKASDIFIEPHERHLRVRYRVDGVLREGPKPPRSTHQGVVCRIKIMSNLNIADHRLPQDGRFKLKCQTRVVDFRVSTIPTYLGEKVCMRILDPCHAKNGLKDLGFETRDLQILEEASSHPHGMILTCGPTGSGKTTTLYSVLNHLNSIERNLVTIEDPVEYAVDGINQVNTRAELGLTFASTLRSTLRQDPDVILVGEIRDDETADIAVKAALTGHLVLSTLHTNTAVGSITRLVNMGIEPFLLTATVILAGSQRLIRKVCSKCAEPYKLTADLKNKIGMKGAATMTGYRAKGCTACYNTGYSGRICIVELLPMSASIKELVLAKATEDHIKGAARREGMVTLRESAVNKLKQGLTTIDEVLRMTMPDGEMVS